MTVCLFCHVPKTPSFFFPKAHSVASELEPKFMFFGIGYNSYILGRLGSVWRSNLGSFGVRDGGPGWPKLVFSGLGSLRLFFFFWDTSRGDLGRYLEQLLGPFRCLLWRLFTKQSCLSAVQIPCSPETSCTCVTDFDCAIARSNMHPSCPSSSSCQYVHLILL